MCPEPEGDVPVGRPADIEPVGVREDALVAVSGADPGHDGVPGAQPDACQLGIGDGVAHEMPGRGDPSQSLLDSGGDQRGVSCQTPQLPGVLGERENRPGRDVRGGEVAAQEQAVAVVDDLVVA
jgi:hypothetical protein